ncbi:MAG: sugar ABC transporter substrate-binding protein [Anaerolineae bacterium]|nr:sugar ABC transporter substrate-binding protein [Anaerolineae bacterium]
MRRSELVKLVYQDWSTPWFPPMAQRMLEEFHAQQPGIRVFFTPDPPNVAETLVQDMAAGTAPDVFAGCCTFFPILAQEKQTLDLKPYVEANLDARTIADWDPAQYAWFFTRDGLQFGLPKYHGALALYYNKDLFDTYGVPYPEETWDHADYLQAMHRLTHDRDGDGRIDLWGSITDISWDRIQMYVNGWGGHLVDSQDPRRPLLCKNEALEAMEWLWERMWIEHVMAAPLDVQDVEIRQAFINQQVAMVEDGSWALKDILAEADFRIGIVPLPAGPVRRVTLATTDGFGIYARTRYPDQAWTLLQFLVSPEFGRAMAEANFLQPARASLVDDWIELVRREYPAAAEEMNLAAFADGHIQGYSVTAEIFANMVDAKRVISEAWHRIYTLGEARPRDLMAAVCQQIEALQARQG